MAQLPFDTSCEALYEDGYILSETDQGDISAYVDCPLVDGIPTGPNTFDDILKKRPVAKHGKMVRFSVFYKNRRYDVDWTAVPDNARPIRFRDGSNSLDGSGNEVFNGYHAVRLGYQYTENGKNTKEIKDL
jgi:hypothetical protein